MENKADKKFKLYGSKTPIFWSKSNEDRPSKEIFESYSFNWELFPNTFNFKDPFTSTYTLKEDTYTYFKLENTETNQITYWYVDSKEKILTDGVVYVLALDTYCSYIINMFANMPNWPMGVERTHLSWEQYNKYVFPYVNDDLLNGGNMGYGPVNVKSPVKWEHVITTQGAGVEFTFPAILQNGTKVTHIYRTGKRGDNNYRWNNDIYPVTRCYVFYDWNKKRFDKDATDKPDTLWDPQSTKNYLIFPVIELKENQDIFQLTGNNDVPDINIRLGNLEHNIHELVKTRASSFIGCFLMPVIQEEVRYQLYTKPVTEGNTQIHWAFYGLPLSFSGEPYNQQISQFVKPHSTRAKYNQYGEVVFPSRTITLNNPNPEWILREGQFATVNFYTFLNINRHWYDNVIASNIIFKPNKQAPHGFNIDLDGYLIFSDGFRMYLNSYDPIIDIGGPLPSDREAYSQYVNGIRETMNAGITASKTNMGLGITKNYLLGTLAAGQAISGAGELLSGNMGGADDLYKGLAGATNATFNIFGAIANHVNTMKMYKAQLDDAKNSISPAITSTSADDLKLFLASKSAGFVRNETGNTPELLTGTLLLKRMSRTLATLNDNIAFLFGVSVKNYIPWSELRTRLEDPNLPCFYLQLTKSFTQTNLYNWVNQGYEFLDMETKQLICDALSIGYRIWKIKWPRLWETYTMTL